MRHLCPACQRTFEEPGFCPFDGRQLVSSQAGSDKQTILSSFVPAQTDADSQTLDSQRSRQIAAAQAEATSKVRSVSASENTDAAIASFKGRVSEYDRLVGETLDGRYFVIAKIGEGGMGVVFSAKHAVIERPLAIKVLKREVMRDAATIRRFVQEAKAASRIGHPNIVDVTDFGTTPDGMTYSVMEFVDGMTLSKALKHGAPFSPERCIRIASQIARALGAAHDKGIVHRDLKPENVFLIDRDGRTDFVKIVDFGIAKVAPLEGADAGPRLTRAGSVFGTPEYMAPEQAAGRNDTDHRVDIYALGTILYEMIVGKVPHKADSMVRTLAMVMLDPITPPSQVNPDSRIPKSLELTIMKSLSKVREQRYATMADMLTALERVRKEINAPDPSVSLPPLPPGADPSLVGHLDPSPLIGQANPPSLLGQIDPPSLVGAPPVAMPRRSKPLTKPMHEPEFVASEKPPTFNLTIDELKPPGERKRWPWILLGCALVAGSATAVALALKPPSDQVATELRDGGVVAMIADGPLVIAEQRSDAGIEEPADARAVAVVADAGVAVLKRRDAGVAAVTHPKLVTIQVFTRPGEANVYVGKTYRGPSEVRITEPYGTRYTITCKAPHMKGTTKVLFDHDMAVMCTAVRVPLCVAGLKNSPDDAPCEEDPDMPLAPDPLNNP
jgi:serine/threonine protein kinase